MMQGAIGQDDIGYVARQPFRFDRIMDEKDPPLPPVELLRDPDHLPGLIDADVAPVQAVKVPGRRSDAAADFDQGECRHRVPQHRFQRIPELRLTGDRRRRIRVLSGIGGGNPVKKDPILLFPGKRVVRTCAHEPILYSSLQFGNLSRRRLPMAPAGGISPFLL